MNPVLRNRALAARRSSAGPIGPTTTIGTADRDYSTITLWEADLDDDGVYDAGMDAVGEMYNDSIFDEEVTIDGGGTLGLGSVVLTVAEGERHDGTAGSGARIESSNAGATSILKIAKVGIRVEWIEVTSTVTLTASCQMLTGAESAENNTGVDYRNCLAHGGLNNNGNMVGIQTKANDSGTHLTLNCVVYDMHATASNRDAYGIFDPPYRSCEILNCTVHNIVCDGATKTAYGIVLHDTPATNLQNCVVTDTVNNGAGTAADFSDSAPSAATVDHNASSDATASGTGSLTSIVTADQYVSTTGGSEDLHLKSGADCIDAGTDLGTTPAGVEIDIDGNDRDAGGVTWSISAHEFNL